MFKHSFILLFRNLKITISHLLLSDWLKSLTKIRIPRLVQKEPISKSPQPRPPAKEKNFPCPNCPAGFSEKASLTRHLRYECGQEPRFKCPYCMYRTKWTSSIYNHVRNKHEGERVYCVDIYADEAVMAGKRSTIASQTKNIFVDQWSDVYYFFLREKLSFS